LGGLDVYGDCEKGLQMANEEPGNLCPGFCDSDWFKSRTRIWLDLGTRESLRGGIFGTHKVGAESCVPVVSRARRKSSRCRSSWSIWRTMCCLKLFSS